MAHSEKELQDIANILRRDSIKATTEAGSGHPTSCMSCAEIMSVLFFHEMKYNVNNPQNPDNDEFVLSKGHAAPILYSCFLRAGMIKNDLLSLRKIDSPLEGHPMPNSLKQVKVATGSLGQGLSVGVGMALAAKKQERDYKTFVLLGDSEIAEGSVYEAMQIAHHYNLDNLVAIVDANRLGQRGETQEGHHIEVYKKRFEAFGFETVAIDGHNVKEVMHALEKSRSQKGPFAIIAKTFKGKGVTFTENAENYHGKPIPKDKLAQALSEIPDAKMPKVEIQKPTVKKLQASFPGKPKVTAYEKGLGVATREGYGNGLANLAMVDEMLIAVDAEVSNSTFSERVKKIEPKQFIETFIQEQNMVGMALGLSVKGHNVFCSTFAAFLTRAHDQIRMAALSSANLTISGSHAGVSIGEDGASQMGLEDLAMFRAMPNSIVLYPGDPVACEKMVFEAGNEKGVKYIRTTRGKTPILYGENEVFPLGDFKVLRESKSDSVVLVGAGITLHECIKAYETLHASKVDAAVVDLYCIKPFNAKKFADFAKKHGGRIVVAEDHFAEGGIGEMLSASLLGTGVEVKRLAVEGIAHSGTPDELVEKHGIGAKSIVNVAEKW